jgi:predicted Abi (CAAX) family protease
MKLLDLLYFRVSSAFSTLPSTESWLIALLLLFVTAIVCLTLGLQSGFLKISKPNLPIHKLISAAVVCFFFPGVAEELIFRVIPLPHITENVSINTCLIWVVLSLFADVIVHPINALTFYKRALPVFTRPVFLVSVSVLGIACTVSYLQSGSIWTAVIIHWSIVVSWLFVFKGYQSLNP